MWELKNRTPYAAERSWTRDKSGAHIWLVAVKATFDIADDGKVTLADEQAPALLAAEFWGDPAKSSVRYEADVVLPKPTTDILVEGTAHAPGGRPATKVPVAFRVANLDKSLVVHGPRTYYVGIGGLELGPAQPFVKHAIRYEDAYGGVDQDDPDPRRHRYESRNPVGKGVTTEPRKLQYAPAHRIEYPIAGFATEPAGLGPVASFWSPRVELLGTYDETWEKRKKPLLPDDWDERTLQCAPLDQRTSQHLVGGEPVALANLTEQGRLSLTLPKIYLTFRTSVAGKQYEHRSKLGAVILAPDERRLMLVWNTALKVRACDVDYLDNTVIGEKAYLT